MCLSHKELVCLPKAMIMFGVSVLQQEVEKALEDALKSIRLSDRGVFVQASTLGSLEALLEFLRTSKVKASEMCKTRFHNLNAIQYQILYNCVVYTILKIYPEHNTRDLLCCRDHKAWIETGWILGCL